MKIHITNQYGFAKEKRISDIQEVYARAGRKLGYYEIGIFVCDLSSEKDSELSSRLDGMIASVERDDAVIVQLPTGNGHDFELSLLKKILAYSGKKPLLLWLSREYYTKYHGEYENWVGGEKIPCLSLKMSELYYQKYLIDIITENIVLEEKNVEDNAEEAIHICFGLHDKTGNYSLWVGAAMQSVIEHTNAYIIFHILHDDTLTEKNKCKINKVANDVGDDVIFHNFDADIFEQINYDMGRYTIGAMFRIMLPDLLSNIRKVIYLDADVFVNRDIKELWDINIDNYCLAAVQDSPTIAGIGIPYPVIHGSVKKEEYFNTGVLYLNLENIRQNGNLKEMVINFLKENPEAWLPDQDALNVIFAGKTLLIDCDWNYFSTDIVKTNSTTAERKIYHFAADILTPYRDGGVDELYYKTILRTPWRDEGEMKVEVGMNRLKDRLKQQDKLIDNLLDDNKKIIFVGKSNASNYLMSKFNAYNYKYDCLDSVDNNQFKQDNVFFIVSANMVGDDMVEKLIREKENSVTISERMVAANNGGFAI